MKRSVYNQIFIIINYCPVKVRALTMPQASWRNNMMLPHPRQSNKRGSMKFNKCCGNDKNYNCIKTAALANCRKIIEANKLESMNQPLYNDKLITSTPLPPTKRLR